MAPSPRARQRASTADAATKPKASAPKVGYRTERGTIPRRMSTTETATRPTNREQYAASAGTDPSRIARRAKKGAGTTAQTGSSRAPGTRVATAAGGGVPPPPTPDAGPPGSSVARSAGGPGSRTMRPVRESRKPPVTNPATAQPATRATFTALFGPVGSVVGVLPLRVVGHVDDPNHLRQIGRASCRERV